MNVTKFGAELIDYKPKMFEIVREGVQVSNADDLTPSNFRTGVKIGNEIAYSMDRIYELVTGVKIQDLDTASNAPVKVIDFIA